MTGRWFGRKMYISTTFSLLSFASQGLGNGKVPVIE